MGRLGLGVEIEIGLHFRTGMLFQDQQNMLIQEHVLLGQNHGDQFHIPQE